MSDTIDQEIRILRAIFWSERDPEGRAFVPLADAYLRKGDPHEALALLDDGLARHPDFASAHLVAARLHRSRGDAHRVRSSLARALELDRGNAEALRMRGEMAEADGELSLALASLREALERNPSWAGELEPRIERLAKVAGPAEPPAAAGTAIESPGDAGSADVPEDTAAFEDFPSLGSGEEDEDEAVSLDDVGDFGEVILSDEEDPGEPLDAPSEFGEIHLADEPLEEASGLAALDAGGGAGGLEAGERAAGFGLAAEDATDLEDGAPHLEDGAPHLEEDVAHEGAEPPAFGEISFEGGAPPPLDEGEAESHRERAGDLEAHERMLEGYADGPPQPPPADDARPGRRLPGADDLVDPFEIADAPLSEPGPPFGGEEAGEVAGGGAGNGAGGDAGEVATSGSPSSPGEPGDPPAGSPALVTRTLGELYARQGLVHRAVEVFETLVAREPGDRELAARLAELRGEAAGEAGPVDEPVPMGEARAEDAPAGEPPAAEPPPGALSGVAAPLAAPSPPPPTPTRPTPEALAERLASRPVGAFFEDLLAWSPEAIPVEALAPGAVPVDQLAPAPEGEEAASEPPAPLDAEAFQRWLRERGR